MFILKPQPEVSRVGPCTEGDYLFGLGYRAWVWPGKERIDEDVESCRTSVGSLGRVPSASIAQGPGHCAPLLMMGRRLVPSPRTKWLAKGSSR